MKTKIVSLILALCLIISVMTINVSAAEDYAFNISATTTNPTVGSEFEVTISLRDYSAAELELQGIQIDVDSIDLNVFEIVSHSSLVVDSSAASNMTSVQDAGTSVRYVYLRLSGGLDRSTTDIMKFKLKVKEGLTQSGTVSMPVTFLVSTTDRQNFTLNDTLTINYVADSSESTEDTKSQDVKAKYNDGAYSQLYSVNVSWGDMQFDYYQADQLWDEENYKWVDDPQSTSGWKTVNDDSNKITIENHSSTAVNASLAFAANDQYTELSGAFTYDGAKLIAPLALELPAENTPAKQYVVTFDPEGKIPETHSDTTYAKMGAITLTLV